MPAKSTARMILDQLSLAELRTFASHYGLPSHGTKTKIAARIASRTRRDVEELVSAQGPWNVSDWNGLVEEMGGARRKSWEDVRAELTRCVHFDRQLLWQRMERIGNLSISDIRRDPDLLSRYADLLLVDGPLLERALYQWHGNTTIGTVWDELIDQLGTQQRSTSDDEVGALPGGLDFGAPSQAELFPTPKRQLHFGEAPALANQVARLEPEPSPELRPGVVVAGRYRIRRSLPPGGMGSAFEVDDVHATSARVLVAKFPFPENVELLAREFVAGESLTHPNICRYVNEERDEIFGRFLVMQHGGESLATRYGARPAAWDDALGIMRQAAAGLDYMHENDRVHGDVSPGNVLIDDRARVRIADLGVSAALVRPTEHRTRQATTVIGKTHYFSAPEVLQGSLVAASDQFSLAAVFCAIVDGVDAWLRSPTYGDNFDSAQREAVERAIHTNPRRRFTGCRELVRALEG